MLVKQCKTYIKKFRYRIIRIVAIRNCRINFGFLRRAFHKFTHLNLKAIAQADKQGFRGL